MRSDPEQPCKRLWPLPEPCIRDSNFLSLLSMDSMLPPGENTQIFGGGVSCVLAQSLPQGMQVMEALSLVVSQ